MRDSLSRISQSWTFFMSCLNNEDKDLVLFLCDFYLSNIDEDAVELTDEVFDLREKLELGS